MVGITTSNDSNCQIKPPISISLHPKKIVAVKTFRPRQIRNLDELTSYVQNYVCSPIIYKNDIRKKENFISAGWIGLDVDDGLPLQDAIDLLKELRATAIIGTTMSHQKQKGESPPCDRYRVLIEMVDSCTDCELYEYNVREWVRIFKADDAVRDGARLFKQCKVVFKQDDLTQDWLKFPAGYKTLSQRREEKFKAEINHHRHSQTLPKWVLNIQKNGVPPGGNGRHGRHHACYRVGAFLTECGYSIEEIGDFLCAGPLIEIGESNVRRQVECAANAAKNHATTRKDSRQ